MGKLYFKGENRTKIFTFAFGQAGRALPSRGEPLPPFMVSLSIKYLFFLRDHSYNFIK